MISRRAFVASLGARALFSALRADAQPAKVFRIGLLGTVPLTEPGASRIWAGFFDGLRQLGYTEGQNVIIEGRYSEGDYERLPTLAAELVRLNVDVIVAAAYAAAAAAHATSKVPIVMTNYADPVDSGLVVSLGRPGGNVTGLTTQSVDLVGKQLELLKEAMPRLSGVAVLSNPDHPHHGASVREAELAARRLRARLQIFKARTPTDIPRTLSAIADKSVDAIIVLGDPVFFGERRQIAELAGKHRVALIGSQSDYADVGGLLTYGIDQRDSFRRAAIYVDKILKGAKPADLPTKFELVINVKSAKALGLTIPQSLLLRADEVIQ